MPIFFIILITVYLGGNTYIFYRGAQALSGLPGGIKISLAVLFWLAALSIIGTMLTRNIKMPVFLSHAMYEVGTGWLIFTLYMVLFLLAFDLLKLCRVPFNYGFILSLIFTVVLLGYGYYNYRHPKTNIINIALDKPLADDAKPVKIVAVSDLHLGNGTGKTALKRYVKMIGEQNPDLILIAGDLIDNSVVPLYTENMMEELSELKAPLGIYMVPGNHEYISGIKASARFIQDTPIQLLRDSVVTLPNGMQLIGRDDRSNTARRSLQELMAGIDKSNPIILLDHQPYKLTESEAAGVDLQFSGHTHRGQVWPMNWVTDHIYEQSHGYRQWGNSHIYVSSGLSLWGPPFRIGTESDMAVFHLSTKK
ncbi:metallophosphoesterase [Bacteroides cellulosilyticus]|mgnify:FL=1|uniref:metallophosphoesterase n=1 Tax=Bacteroides cellulosilyticus TaxID=246787 RepID=UPI001C379736|nr:metallophosphoesterase [Bacteroides cellulosilyticus]MBV3637589.1 metallophosphoesterase [Bacteroides cellulosilyticus]MBV3663930.1 metallophosphoesterase [Bacteroides cellulosilyticus]MBV3687787.1 metallophosphoesterase [Bacteroides cellulosilyticus]MBV3694603.1 metallophosphoesterase [Bacteroides cellulosilyticus]MBV3708129.1 metallophosphoesterase [Bacteroides cellulosilyticus]